MITICIFLICKIGHKAAVFRSDPHRMLWFSKYSHLKRGIETKLEFVEIGIIVVKNILLLIIMKRISCNQVSGHKSEFPAKRSFAWGIQPDIKFDR